MKKPFEQSQNDYWHKMYQIYEHIKSCEKRNEPITRGLLEDFIKSCSSPNGGRKGCATNAIGILKEQGIIQKTHGKFYTVKMRNLDDKMHAAASELALQKRKSTQSQVTKQDIAQSPLFTESVMREQDQPIVTASDQLRQQIAQLESKLNTIITFFKTL